MLKVPESLEKWDPALLNLLHSSWMWFYRKYIRADKRSGIMYLSDKRSFWKEFFSSQSAPNVRRFYSWAGNMTQLLMLM